MTDLARAGKCPTRGERSFPPGPCSAVSSPRSSDSRPNRCAKAKDPNPKADRSRKCRRERASGSKTTEFFFLIFPWCLGVVVVEKEFTYHHGTKTPRKARLEGDAFDSVFEERDVEVDQQAEALAGQFEVGQKLCLENRDEVFDRFQFNENAILDEHVQAHVGVEANSFVDNRHGILCHKSETALAQFVAEANFVNRFGESWSERSMNFERCIDNLPSNGVNAFWNWFDRFSEVHFDTRGFDLPPRRQERQHGRAFLFFPDPPSTLSIVVPKDWGRASDTLLTASLSLLAFSLVSWCLVCWLPQRLRM